MSGGWILGAVLALTAAVGVWHRLRAGRFRAKHDQRDLRGLLGIEPGEAGERATLLQFSSAFCAPCRATKRILHDVAEVVPGVAHVEIDAESHLTLVRQLNIVKTPTTLVLDGRGHEVLRATGQPSKNAVLHALSQAVPS